MIRSGQAPVPEVFVNKLDFDLTPRIPRRARSAAALEDSGEVKKILDESRERGFLVVPYRFAGTARALSNSWWKRCEAAKIPFIRVNAKPDGSGYVFFDPWTARKNLSLQGVDALCRKLDELHKSLSGEEEALIDKAMPNGGFYSMGHGHGFVGFCPSIAQGVIRTVGACLSDPRNLAS